MSQRGLLRDWFRVMKGIGVAASFNKTQFRNCFLALSLPLLLTGCGLREWLAEAEATSGGSFWIVKFWILSLIWIVPVPVLYGFLANGRYQTITTPEPGTGPNGEPIIVYVSRRGDWIEGNEEAGIQLAAMWLILFPVGYALYPWYAPIWLAANYASFTPFPNLNWHLVKWGFPLLVLILAGALIGHVLSRQSSNRIAGNLVKAGKVMMWLGVAWVIAPPAYVVINHLFKRPESEMVATLPEPPARPLPSQPKDLKIPKNGEFDPYATQLWSCKVGFVQVGDTCQKK